ncbi:NUDIX domain-containing protein [Candidatus Kaiserbacteria bacterium]|nr:NUDIX domain-containing protein [Candidatus Kaiserbacteria bacterium]
MNTDIRVAVLIEKDGKFLLGQEATKIIYGLWNWQQGKVEDGEDLEAAAMREVKEETGFDIEIVKKLTIINNPFPGTKETHVYLGKIIGGELAYSAEEILNLKWFTREQIIEIQDKLSGNWLVGVIDSLDLSQ